MSLQLRAETRNYFKIPTDQNSALMHFLYQLYIILKILSKIWRFQEVCDTFKSRLYLWHSRVQVHFKVLLTASPTWQHRSCDSLYGLRRIWTEMQNWLFGPFKLMSLFLRYTSKRALAVIGVCKLLYLIENKYMNSFTDNSEKSYFS